MTEDPVEYEIRRMFELPDETDKLIEHITPEFGHWLAGFLDGEGHFGVRALRNIVRRDGTTYEVHQCKVHLNITLRADDIGALEYIQENLGCGVIRTDILRPPANPQSIFSVNRIRDIVCVVVPTLTRYPLRAKKSREFPLWKRAAEIAYHSKTKRQNIGGMMQRPLTDALWREFQVIETTLKALRRYNG